VAVEKEVMASYGKVVQDKGHGNMKLKDFLQCDPAKKGKLELYHIAALRLYTSDAYKCINEPLRKSVKPHPYPATTYFMTQALKKLRAVNSGAGVMERKEFWRGMKVGHFSRDFLTLQTPFTYHLLPLEPGTPG
jgi:hypothetical protein